MTSASFLVAIGLASCIAGIVGWILQRRGLGTSLAANWAVGVSTALAIPTLLSDSPMGLARVLWPREAIDWLPMATICLLIALSVFQKSKAWSRFAILLGAVLCIVLAFRFLYGSVYLRPGTLHWKSFAAIASWGACMVITWLATSSISEPGKSRSWVEVLVCSILIASVSGTIGMSGSFTYCAIGLIVATSAIASWVVTAELPRLSLFQAICLVGLGVAFAELSIVAGAFFGIAIMMASLILSGIVMRYRLPILTAAAILGFAILGITAMELRAKLLEKSKGYGGYEAYK